MERSQQNGRAADCGHGSGPPQGSRALHRIRTVRRQQGISIQGAARKLRVEPTKLRAQEEESTDLHLSDLYRWQKALDVPIADLLIDNEGPLSAPVMKRAQLVKVMKTVEAIMEKARSGEVRRMAETLKEQLVEIMPELEGVSPWHSVGQRRTLDEFGRVAERCFSDHVLRDVLRSF